MRGYNRIITNHAIALDFNKWSDPDIVANLALVDIRREENRTIESPFHSV